MEIMAFSIGGIVSILMLIGGIALTVVTILRMRMGSALMKIRQHRVIMTMAITKGGAMIAMVLIQAASLLPPDIVRVDNPFEEEYIHIVTPSAPESIEAAP